MAEEKKGNEDELLADAIPIDELEVMEDDAAETKSRKRIGAPGEDDIEAIDLEETDDEDIPQREIKTFGAGRSHQSEWKRKPNATGTGAIHVKTFVAKLRIDAIEYMDQQINQWLDENEEYEVKFVTTHIGDLRGKTVEPALFVNVWV